MTTSLIGFNSNDFFYQNVNAPITFDNSLCSLSPIDLKTQITGQYNLKISQIKQPMLNNGAGQCKLTKIDTSNMDEVEKSKLTSNWKLEYSTNESGRQSCNCVADNTYISSDPNVFSTQFGSPVNPTSYYSCANSSTTAVQDVGINDVNLDENQKQSLIDKTVDYYKSVCRNKELADQLQNNSSTSENHNQKYEDGKTLYNREYLNRINLGVGIFMTCGFIYYTIILK